MKGEGNGFTALLQKYMHRRNVSRRELAEALGVGPVIFKYVNGSRTVPNLNTVETIWQSICSLHHLTKKGLMIR